MTTLRAAPNTSPQWDSGVPRRHPAFEFLCEQWSFTDTVDWPDIDAMQTFLNHGCLVSNAAGRPLRLIASTVASALAYEASVYERAQLHVCPRSWHDLFNVVAWRTYPRSKSALNERHMRDLASSTGLSTRSRVRDTLTGFDEDGIVVASTRRELLALIREFRWRELFWAQRDAWATALHVFPFGHALMEKLLDPFLGLTAKAVLVVVTDDFVTMNPQQRLEHIDERVSDRLSSVANFATPQWLSPLPILGIPGWHPDNEHPAFYDNTQYFRTGRSAPPQVIIQDVRT